MWIRCDEAEELGTEGTKSRYAKTNEYKHIYDAMCLAFRQVLILGRRRSHRYWLLRLQQTRKYERGRDPCQRGIRWGIRGEGHRGPGLGLLSGTRAREGACRSRWQQRIRDMGQPLGTYVSEKL